MSNLYKIRNRAISILVVLIIICITFTGCVQEKAASASDDSNTDIESTLSINEENIMNIIKELTSEKYKGRLAGSKENHMAAQYISEYFRKIGLENPKGLSDYMQEYIQPKVSLTEKPVLQIIDKAGKVTSDFDYPENFVFRRLSSENNAIDINTSMVLVEDPSLLRKGDGSFKGKIILIPWKLYNQLGSQNEPADYAKTCGALGVISEFDLEKNDLDYRYLKVRPLVGSWMRSDGYKPFAFVDSNTFSKLTEAAQKGSKLHISCNSEVNINNVATNVVGLLPGSDVELKNDYIIIGAHFDHVGDNMDGTYNPGALDNASGVSTMMELAKAIKESNMKPKKSILFIAFNGEESGLQGAWYYTQHPVYPLENSVMINMDMIGAAGKTPLTIAISSISSNTSLGEDIAKHAEKLGIDYEKGIEAGSDHTPFDQSNVPSVCLINMEFKTGYHSPNDNIEAIDKEKLKGIADLVLYYIAEQAY